MTPQQIGEAIDSAMPGALAMAPRADPLFMRREIARGTMKALREAGRLEEPPAAPEQLPPMPPSAEEPEIGQWARVRSRCDAGHGRHRRYDDPISSWHLVKYCRGFERHNCCRFRGHCGARLRTGYFSWNGHCDYFEVADAPPEGACRTCLGHLERQRQLVDRFRELVER